VWSQGRGGNPLPVRHRALNASDTPTYELILTAQTFKALFDIRWVELALHLAHCAAGLGGFDLAGCGTVTMRQAPKLKKTSIQENPCKTSKPSNEAN
jgi:hypothetical protein